MATIPQTTFWNTISWTKIFVLRISLEFIPKGPINNKSAFVQVKTWRWAGEKPLPEPVLTQLNDAYMRH